MMVDPNGNFPVALGKMLAGIFMNWIFYATATFATQEKFTLDGFLRATVTGAVGVFSPELSALLNGIGDMHEMLEKKASFDTALTVGIMSTLISLFSMKDLIRLLGGSVNPVDEFCAEIAVSLPIACLTSATIKGIALNTTENKDNHNDVGGVLETNGIKGVLETNGIKRVRNLIM